MSISKPLSIETVVSVRRSVSFTALRNSSGRIYVRGPCGSGKSTHAIVGYAKANPGKFLVIVQPDEATTSLSKGNLNELYVAKKIGKKFQVVSARDFCMSVVNGVQYGSDIVVVVDEIHTRNYYTPAALEWVRMTRAQYIVITATPGGEAVDSSTLVANKEVVDRNVGYDKAIRLEPYTNTTWDPSTWSGLRRAVIYSVNANLTNRLSRYYGHINMPYFVLSTGSAHKYGKVKERMKDPTQFFVLFVMSGVGDGLTIHADILFDTGYTMDTVCTEHYAFSKIRKITASESSQRRARIGRNNSGVVVHPGLEYGSEERSDMTYYYMNALIVLKAMGVTSDRLVNSLPSRLHSFSRAPQRDCIGVVKQSGDPVNNLIRNAGSVEYLRDAFQLYRGNGTSIPLVYMNSKVTSIDDIGRNLYDLCPTSNVPFRGALKTVHSNPSVMFVAVLGMIFGRFGYYNHKLNVESHLNKLLTNLGIRVNPVMLGVIVSIIGVDKTSNGYRYFNKYSSSKGSADLIDEKDISTGKPQKRFSSIVDWSTSINKVDLPEKIVKQSSLFNAFTSSHLDGVRVGEATNPGPDRPMASRLHRWSNGFNATIAIKIVDTGHELPYIRDWQSLDNEWKSIDKGPVSDLEARVIVAYVCESNDGDTHIKGASVDRPIELVGFSIHTISDAALDFTEIVDLSYDNFFGEEVTRKCALISNDNNMLVRSSCLKSAIKDINHTPIFRKKRCAVSTIWRWSLAKGTPVIISIDSNGRFSTLEKLSKQWDATVKSKKKPHLFSVMLSVHIKFIESVGDGSYYADEDVRGFFEIDSYSLVEVYGAVFFPAQIAYINGLGELNTFNVISDAGISDRVDIYGENMWGNPTLIDIHTQGERVGEAKNPGPKKCCSQINRLYRDAYKEGLTKNVPCYYKSNEEILSDGYYELNYGLGKRVHFKKIGNRLGCHRDGYAGYTIRVPKNLCIRCSGIIKRVFNNWKTDFNYTKKYRHGEAKNPGPINARSDLEAKKVNALVTDREKARIAFNDWDADFNFAKGYRFGEAKNPGPMDGSGPVSEDNPPVPVEQEKSTLASEEGGEDERVNISNLASQQQPRISNIISTAVTSRRRLGPSILNAQITSTGSGDFSPIEDMSLSAIERKYEEGSYFVNLAFFAVETDGSDKYDRNMKVQLTLNGGGVETITWSSIFNEMSYALDQDRFTIRRYLSLRAPLIIEAFEMSDTLKEWFASGKCSLRARNENLRLALSTMSWAKTTIKSTDRPIIDQFNRTRQVELDGKFNGDIRGFSRVVNRPVSTKPPVVEENNVRND